MCIRFELLLFIVINSFWMLCLHFSACVISVMTIEEIIKIKGKYLRYWQSFPKCRDALYLGKLCKALTVFFKLSNIFFYSFFYSLILISNTVKDECIRVSVRACVCWRFTQQTIKAGATKYSPGTLWMLSMGASKPLFKYFNWNSNLNIKPDYGDFD